MDTTPHTGTTDTAASLSGLNPGEQLQAFIRQAVARTKAKHRNPGDLFDLLVPRLHRREHPELATARAAFHTHIDGCRDIEFASYDYGIEIGQALAEQALAEQGLDGLLADLRALQDSNPALVEELARLVAGAVRGEPVYW